MKRRLSISSTIYSTVLASALLLPIASTAVAKDDDSKKIKPVITEQVIKEAMKNRNWKKAVITGEHAQIVFMSISPKTNPANEIGMETHKFDQVIFIADGHAKAVIDGVTSKVKSGDLIFIPQGLAHNIINSDSKKPLNIISVYSETDIPAGTTNEKKSDSKE